MLNYFSFNSFVSWLIHKRILSIKRHGASNHILPKDSRWSLCWRWFLVYFWTPSQLKDYQKEGAAIRTRQSIFTLCWSRGTHTPELQSHWKCFLNRDDGNVCLRRITQVWHYHDAQYAFVLTSTKAKTAGISQHFNSCDFWCSRLSCETKKGIPRTKQVLKDCSPCCKKCSHPMPVLFLSLSPSAVGHTDDCSQPTQPSYGHRTALTHPVLCPWGMQKAVGKQRPNVGQYYSPFFSTAFIYSNHTHD